MKNAYYGAIFIGILVLSNVVAAGVFQVLGPLALSVSTEEVEQAGALALVGVLAVGCALAFLNGSLRAIVASLQSSPRGRRGG